MSVPEGITYTSQTPSKGEPLTMRIFTFPEPGELLSSTSMIGEMLEAKFSESSVESVPEVKLEL